MKLNITPRVQADQALLRELKDHAQQVNAVSEGRIAGAYNAQTAAPVGLHQQGDFVRNSAPTELGAVASKYVIFGWSCTVGGDPATFVQCRFLTGN